MRLPRFAFRNFASDYLNWRLVRGVGELQILTRASYATLVVVPILASLWPAVRTYVNNHNQAVQQATIAIQQTAGDLNNVLQKLKTTVETHAPEDAAEVTKSLTKIESGANNLLERVAESANEFSRRPLKSPVLPWTLAASFFGALSVVVAHTFYEFFAPQEVRQQSLDQFVSAAKEDYAKHPTSDALAVAKTLLSSELDHAFYFDLYDTILHEDNVNECNSHLRSFSRDQLEEFVLWIDTELLRRTSQQLDQTRSLALGVLGVSDTVPREMSTIERAAKKKYLQLARESRLLTIPTVVHYLIALYIIGALIFVQCQSVMNAAEWPSIRSAFVIPPVK